MNYTITITETDEATGESKSLLNVTSNAEIVGVAGRHVLDRISPKTVTKRGPNKRTTSNAEDSAITDAEYSA